MIKILLPGVTNLANNSLYRCELRLDQEDLISFLPLRYA